MIVTGASVVTTILFSSMAAYALTRHRIPFAGPITVLLLGGMMLAPTVALIPLFRLLQAIGIFDTVLGADRPVHGVPDPVHRLPDPGLHGHALARDGGRGSSTGRTAGRSSGWSSCRCRARSSSAALLQALFAWNEFVFALVFINDTDLKTLPVGLRRCRAACCPTGRSCSRR